MTRSTKLHRVHLWPRAAAVATLAGLGLVTGCGGDDDGAGPTAATHFEEWAPWTSPVEAEVGARGVFTTDHGDPELSRGNWSTMDLTGDGRPDLVVTRLAGSASQLGLPGPAPHWRVYPGTDTGFAPDPLEWPTPRLPEQAAEGLVRVAQTSSIDGSWMTSDLDGDGLLDLVELNPESEYITGDPQFGFPADPHWRVYRNNGQGFDPDWIPWSTPASDIGQLGFFAPTLESTSYYLGAWSMLDLDGDARPELVVLRAVSTSDVFGFPGDPHWQVHHNDGTGFAATATRWSVPEEALAGASGVLLTQGETWSTMDLDGDARPELVFTRDGGGRQLGHPDQPHWRVYRNVGDGFAADGEDWTTPGGDGVSTNGFHQPGGGGAAAQDGQWATVDLDGDRRLDLVVTRFAGDPGQPGHPEDPYWEVYPGAEGGFTDPGLVWTLPTELVFTTAGFDRLGHLGDDDHGVWSTMDLDGDHRPELVLTAGSDQRQLGYPDAPSWMIAYGRP